VTAPDAPPPSPRRNFLRTPLGRFGVLLAVVVVTGAAAGFALAWPVSQIELDVRTATQLNQDALAGTFDPEAALATAEDAPDGWVPADPSAVGLLGLIGVPICGTTPEGENRVGEPLQSVFRDEGETEWLISQVIRFRSPRDANQFITEVTSAFDSCSTFFWGGAGGDRTKVEIRDGQPDPPVADYVSRTLIATDGGLSRRVSFIQLGSVVVVLQAVGPTRPADSVLDDAELGILQRVAPKDFPKVRPVDGAKPLPVEATTTTTTTTLPPTTTAPPPTTTTAKKRTS
jgi:hypothetical protein